MTERTGTCEICGTEMQVRHPLHFFCSDACRDASLASRPMTERTPADGVAVWRWFDVNGIARYEDDPDPSLNVAPGVWRPVEDDERLRDERDAMRRNWERSNERQFEILNERDEARVYALELQDEISALKARGANDA